LPDLVGIIAPMFAELGGKVFFLAFDRQLLRQKCCDKSERDEPDDAEGKTRTKRQDRVAKINRVA
jgi:hypothetical protein